VHIVWNEHDRDYKIDMIGGDFGNAQIIVTPLPNDQYSIQIYRDAKVRRKQKHSPITEFPWFIVLAVMLFQQNQI
jgi:hypothetical protein